MSDEQWHEWRNQGIGASEVPAVLGKSSFDSPYSLWARKTGQLARTETTQRQRIGQVLEGAIAQLFHEQTGYHVAGEQTWCQHPKHDWARATIDGLVLPDIPGANHIDDALGVLEIKTDGAPAWPDGIPPRIEAQVQWQMFVTDMPRAWVAVLHSGFRFDVHEVLRDNDAIETMFDTVRAFWFDHVLTGVAPPVDGADATRDALAEVWPNHQDGKVVEVDDMVELLVERDELKSYVKLAEKDLSAAENRIRERMGDAEVATVGGVPVLTLKTQTKTGLDSKALRLAHPDIAAQYETTSTFRVLRAVASKVRSRAA